MGAHGADLTYRFLAIFVGIVLAVMALLVIVDSVRAECRPYPITAYSPTGVVGCSTYGSGLASWWSGPGVARNDCEWPWTDCTPIRITSLDTGLTLVIQPTMYCDCYTGTANQRLVDLDPAALKALGLWEMRDQGLFEVRVSPASSSTPMSSSLSLPDTALPMP